MVHEAQGINMRIVYYKEEAAWTHEAQHKTKQIKIEGSNSGKGSLSSLLAVTLSSVFTWFFGTWVEFQLHLHNHLMVSVTG